jgi:prevent-host-death family protein
VPAPKRKLKLKQAKKTDQDKRGTWQVQSAKARFSEVLRRARAEGPQIVTKQGKEDVVILPVEQYRKLTRRSRQPASLVQFFAQSPLAGLDLQLERASDYGRDIEL